MRKGTYAYLDGIPDRTSDLYNDGGFLNETEVQAEIGNYLDIDDATVGQVLTMGESGFPEWEDVSGGGISYSTSEVDTGATWVDGKKVYQKTWVGKYNDSNAFIDNVDTLISVSGVALDINDRWTVVPTNNSSSSTQVNFQLLNNGEVLGYNVSRVNSSANVNMKITLKYTKKS